MVDEITWYYKNAGGNGTYDVAQKRANGFGLYDTIGNAWEWVSDWYDPNYYQNSPASDPAGPASGTIRILRGGAGPGRLTPRASAYLFAIFIYPVGMYAYGGVGLRCAGEANGPWKIATNSGP
jgi:formylglycine-generating enzyme required for sulfatase activity